MNIHFREIKEKDVSLKKTFSPIRKILLFDDKKWNSFIEKKDSKETLAAVESLFAINEIFPYGLPGWRHELGKFLADIDTLQVTFSFLESISNTKVVENVLYDIRISIQNFMFYLKNKSFYCAFQEFRKFLEGILWIDMLSKNTKDIPKEITKTEYTKNLSEIDEEFGNLYKKLNNLFHYKKNEQIYFNINSIYNPDDNLYILLKMITKNSDRIIIFFNDSIRKIDNIFIQKYCVLYDVLEKAREWYNLKNYPIRKTDELRLPNGAQERFASAILDEGKNVYRLKNLVNGYEFGLKEYLCISHIEDSKIIPLEKVFRFLSKYNDEFLNFIPFLNYKNISDIRKQNSLMMEIRKEVIIQNKEKTIQYIIDTLKTLFEAEIKSGGNLDIAILKSILEDILINFNINKFINFLPIFYLRDFLFNKFKISFNKMIDFVKYKHIIVDDNIKNITIDGKETGKAKLINEYECELVITLDKINKFFNSK